MANYSPTTASGQFSPKPPCPHCGGFNSFKKGKHPPPGNGQKMWCKDCKKGFTVGTSHSRSAPGASHANNPCPACGSTHTVKSGFGSGGRGKPQRRCKDCGKNYLVGAAWRVKRTNPDLYPCEHCGGTNTHRAGGEPVAGNPDGHRRKCNECKKTYTALGRGQRYRPQAERERVRCPDCGTPARLNSVREMLGRRQWRCGQCGGNWLSLSTIYLRLLTQTKAFCQGCAADFSDKPEHLEIDHLVPRIKGGTDEMDNLTLLCRRCNTAKNSFRTLKDTRERVARLYGMGDASKLLDYGDR